MMMETPCVLRGRIIAHRKQTQPRSVNNGWLEPKIWAQIPDQLKTIDSLAALTIVLVIFAMNIFNGWVT